MWVCSRDAGDPAGGPGGEKARVGHASQPASQPVLCLLTTLVMPWHPLFVPGADAVADAVVERQ